MVQDHWRVWICPFGCVGDYSSSLGLRDHLHKTHTTEVARQDVDITVSLSSVADVRWAEGPCPLCHDVHIQTSHEYQSHIGNHLEQLALFVLPTQDGDDDDHETTNDESGSSQDNEFETEEKRRLNQLVQEEEDNKVEQGAVDDVEDLENERISPATLAVLDQMQNRWPYSFFDMHERDSQQAQVEQQMPKDLERSPRGPTIDFNPKWQRLPPDIGVQIMETEHQIRAIHPEMNQKDAHEQALNIIKQRLMQNQVERNSVAQNAMDKVAGSTRQQPGMADVIPVAASPQQYAQMLRQQQQAAMKLLQENTNREKGMKTTGILYDKRLDMTSDSSSGSSKPPRTTIKTSEPDQPYHNYTSTLPNQHYLEGPKNFLTADDLRRMREIHSKSSSVKAESGYGCSGIARNSMDPDDMTIFVKGMGSLTIGNAQLDIRDEAEIAIRTTGSSRDSQQDKDSASSPKASP